MGIRFRCHQCGHELHVKDFQAGKRSRCPECETKFRIPTESADFSIRLDNSQPAFAANSQTATNSASSGSASGNASGSATGTLPSKLTQASSIDAEPEVAAQADAPQELETVSNSVALAVPQAIQEAPGATWYVRPPAGGQYGPAPASIFCEWLTESRVTRDSLVWRDGWPQWIVAGEAFADYFGPVLPTTTPTALAPAPVPSLAPSLPLASPAEEQTAAPEFVAPTSLSDRAIAARKRQRKKNYMIMIGILATISVGLVIALVVVLMSNS